MNTFAPAHRSDRGRLKLFLGMVAGVGKTCAMLEAGIRLRNDGSDVAVGFVETHERKYTRALLRDLEILPRARTKHQGAVIEEMDLDAILARRPDWVLVDELAHSNAPGSRHPKRFMDVEDLLRAGINVLSTLNVQHFESRLDIVRELTGVTVTESVPDSVLDMADEIELVDISPEELLSRLQKGEIYPPEKVQRSLQGFFKRGTLTALREISLRLAAEKVDNDVLDAVKMRELPQKLSNRDRLMVAIGPSPSATELLRWTRNKAFNLEAPWIAAYIDTGRYLSLEDRKLVDANIELARYLGAEIVTVSDPSVSHALVELARTKQVTEIVMGRPRMSFLHRLLAPESPVDRLYRQKQSFTIAIVATDKIKTPTLWELAKNRFLSAPAEYAVSLANVAVTSAVLFVALPLVGYRGVGLIYLFAVLLQALVTGRGPLYLAAFLAALSWNFFFIPPRFNFHVGEKEDVIHLIVFVAMASVLGSLTNKIRARELAHREGEARANLLLASAKIFADKASLGEILGALAELLNRELSVGTTFYFKGEDPADFAFRPEGRPVTDVNEQGVARWCVNNVRRAGRDTETLPQAAGLYFPVHSNNEVFGALGIYPAADEDDGKQETGGAAHFSYAQKTLLEAISGQLSAYLERRNYFHLVTKTRALEESSRLQKALFSSISHELKTPLTAIMGAAQTLASQKDSSSDAGSRPILRELLDSGGRLTHVVDQLLDMSRLESGRLVAKRDWVSMEEVVGLVLGRLESRLTTHRVVVTGVAELSLVRADFSLAVDVVRNAVVNALQYAKASSRIEIRGVQSATEVGLEVVDDGPGVAPDFAAKLFERFSREHPQVTGGLGLGLSICRGFMEAMGGRMEASNRSDGVTGFCVKLVFRRETEEA